MTTQHFELTDGRLVPVLCEVLRRDYAAYVLRIDEGDPDDVAGVWALTWTDGINWWYEEYEFPWLALGRLTALVAAVEQDVFMVHTSLDDREGPPALVEEVNRFTRRTVHAFDCPAGCDGTGSTNHDD